ncbi:MAG TPA: hypothetical protein VL979_02040 [Solirubrobacteraceae bacterium]|nr:hypothetical protein [Solirubrobacteraceae bacterium]
MRRLPRARPRRGRAVRRRSAAALAALAALALLAGCGGEELRDAPAERVAGDVAAHAVQVSSGCSAAVLGTLASVLARVYREGVHSERTASAEYMITHSAPLREALEARDRTAARAALRTLIASGHMTDVSIELHGRPFVQAGGPALAPLRGTLLDARGAPLATYTASVWADRGFLSEGGGITQGVIVLRSGGHSLGGSISLPAGLAGEGALTRAGVPYRYTSFAAGAYPSGSQVRVYLLIPTAKVAPLCAAGATDTTVNALRRVARLIYAAEVGRAARKQVARVQRNLPLLEAVARREPEATRLAIDALLHEHVVRMRVTVAGQLLSDVGGPYVLGPVSAPLRLHGRKIGELTLSVQDDEGYLRLTRRLAGLAVLMYMPAAEPSGPPQLVKDSLGGPAPALSQVPESGPYRDGARSFRVFTLHREAFPSGPLTIRVLVPLPYERVTS